MDKQSEAKWQDGRAIKVECVRVSMGEITHLGGKHADGEPWLATVDDVAAAYLAGVVIYFDTAEGGSSYLLVARRRGAHRVRLEIGGSDATALLLMLPRCRA